MATTPKYALPYPGLSDTADVPRDIQALADRLDLVIGPPLVAALPGSPVDGQEIVYQNTAMAADGVAWPLRYRAAAAGSFKWEFVGGADWIKTVDPTQAHPGPGSAWGDLATVGPEITLPLAGDYLVRFGAEISPVQDGSTAAMGIGYGAFTGAFSAALAWVLFQLATGANGSSNDAARAKRINGAAAAAVLRARYWTSSGSHTFGGRHLSVQPIRVG